MTIIEVDRRQLRDHLTAFGLGFAALLLRVWHLGTPKGFVFDEVYYAQNAN